MENLDNVEILEIRKHRELADEAARWFHSKWGIPLEAYAESIASCLEGKSCVPQWYVAVSGGRIVGGLGVIENDFHDRKDLTPNVCAVYVEEAYRCRGIAGRLLAFVCEDMARMGVGTLYLLTDHTSFYERYGWEFLCMAQGDGEPAMSRMYVHKTDTARMRDAAEPENRGRAKETVAQLLRAACDIAILVLLFVFALSLLYCINGSQEAFPTEEDHEKVRAATAALMFLSGVPCLACIAARVRLGKKRRH